MHRVRQHLTYANIISTLCLFLLLGGGTAVALNGKNTVQSDDIGPGAQVNAADVVNNGLTGADIKDRSGVDTCVNTVRLGNLCVRAENAHRSWSDALQHCANLGLRAPSVGEALELAKTRDIPNVDQTEYFWTDNTFYNADGFWASVVDDTGFTGFTPRNLSSETVCVTNAAN